MNKQFNIRQILKDNPLIPVVRFENINEIEPVVNHLVKSNIKCIEITLRTPISFDAIEYVKLNFKNKLLLELSLETALMTPKKKIKTRNNEC